MQHGGYAAFVETRGDLLAQAGHAVRQLGAATGRFAQPERDIRRHALGVFHAQAIALDAKNAVAGVAQLEDVAGEAFHGEVFVDGADDGGLRLQHHQVIGGVGDGAAGGDRGKSRIAARTQFPVDGIAMDVRTARPVPCGEAVGQHAHGGVELLAGEVAVGIGAT